MLVESSNQNSGGKGELTLVKPLEEIQLVLPPVKVVDGLVVDLSEGLKGKVVGGGDHLVEGVFA